MGKMERDGYDLDRMNEEDHKFLHEFLKEHPEFRDVNLRDTYFTAKASLEALPPERMDQAREYERFMQLSAKIARPNIEPDDTEWLSKMLEFDKDAFGLREWLEDPAHAHIARLPFAEAGVWITAMKQDLEARVRRHEKERAEFYRAHGCIAPDDAMLVGWVLERITKKLRAPRLTIVKGMEYLRLMKRRTRKEQKALSVWDRYYAGQQEFFFPDEEAMDRIESELERQWEAEDAGRRTGANAAGAACDGGTVA